MNMIKKPIVLAIVTSALSLAAGTAFAAEDIVATAHAACQKDITTFCKDVTEGEGRILACLASHEDKLSGRCTYTLADTSLQVQRLKAAVVYVAVECKADLEKHCSDIPAGDGRIVDCLKKNQSTASESCKQAIKDTQMQGN